MLKSCCDRKNKYESLGPRRRQSQRDVTVDRKASAISAMMSNGAHLNDVIGSIQLFFRNDRLRQTHVQDDSIATFLLGGRKTGA